MTGSIYAAVGYTCALVCLILFRCNREMFASKAGKGFIYIWLLTGYTAFGIVDGTWGLMDSGIIDLGVTGFYAVSYLFHFFATLAVLGWFVFISIFFNKKEPVWLKIIEGIPLIPVAILLIMQFFNDCIYSIDESLVYHSGPYRRYLFNIQFLYLLLSFIKGLYFLYKNRRDKIWEHRRLVLEFTLTPLAACIMQTLFPNDPYYSIGIILTSIAIFNGIIVIDNSRENGRYELVSRETYKALEALCQGFVSVHLFDFRENTQTQIKSSIFIDMLANNGDNAHDQIISVIEGICCPEYRDSMVEFVDTYTLDERVGDKRSISAQFESKVSGWCLSTFIIVERDENNHIIKAIHSVQNIDETKRKELEFTQAIKRAYENKNAIYAELVKMQSVGMIATDESENLILANDVAASMFGYEGQNIEGMTFADFFSASVMETPESSTEKYQNIRRDGGQFSYEIKIPAKTEEEQSRYLMADVKRVDLMDGSKVMVTCYSDITKRKMLEKKLRNLSDIDGLTGIANRRCGEKNIQLMLQEKCAGLFCMLDVNSFKSINDNFGHKTGDDALIAVAEAIRKSFRSDDIIMRMGGDEFAIFAKNVTSTGLAKSKIERLFENIEDIDIKEMNGEHISISLGAVLIEEGREVEYVKLYSAADEAMYTCKGLGGNNMSIVEI